MRTVMFAGPSLPPRARPDLGLDIDWLPPVRQGDLYRAALSRPAVIGVIDGYFEVTPTVWHKEILWAMAQGVHVFGSASIGALRAAELDAFGMKGIGRIYEDFRDSVLQDDDEVAVLHGPAELGYPPLTEAMVNIRATLGAATSAGVICPELATELTTIAKALFYKERTWETILATASDRYEIGLQQFTSWLPVGRVDQKRLDSMAMLAAIRKLVAARVTPVKIAYEFAETAAWKKTVRLG
jgi:hypothetical protein